MDITQAETIAVAIVGLVAPVFVQVVKPILPDNMTALFSLAVSVVMGGKLGKTFVDENKLA